ncbi:HDIG domain-containing protein [Methanoculleus sp. FWC-SCC1]|uniref:HDIG domain-containing protein n=1 Tax=Methanoculleus frigidifontis TaxID=2584085 RepID=A0ABT8M944_9EURY|nr:HDIG domain-containing metalloprotein [Methanoculleus sp. FWC-SCC1]MDN7024461.1 HDIG domain-containing protein [Methanoculleus sp. FWC-SCC1]
MTEHLLKKLESAGCSPGVVAHCRAVREVALTFAADPLVDRQHVDEGALLHDIGRGVSHALDHAEIGGALCRAEGLAEEVAAIVERHIGAGFTADECSLLGLLPRDCMPRTIEEKIVAHADNLVKGTRIITIEERLMHSLDLPARLKKRMYRLHLEMELFR